MSEIRLDLSASRRLSVSYTADRRKAFVVGAKISVGDLLIEPERLVLDTGSEVDLIVPPADLVDGVVRGWTSRTLGGLTGHRVRARVGKGELLLGPHTQAVELWVTKQASECIVGLPVLRSFFLFLVEQDAQLPTGPCLYHPRSALPCLPHP